MNNKPTLTEYSLRLREVHPQSHDENECIWTAVIVRFCCVWTACVNAARTLMQLLRRLSHQNLQSATLIIARLVQHRQGTDQTTR